MTGSPNNALRIAIREVVSGPSDRNVPLSWAGFLEALAERGFSHVRMKEIKTELNAAIADLEGEML